MPTGDVEPMPHPSYPLRASKRSIALALLAVALLAAASVGPTAVARSAARAPSTALYVASTEAPQPRNLTFYMHNNTLAQSVNGVSSSFLFDTLQKFGLNQTVSNLGRVRQDWYLYPALAGPLHLNGTVSLHVFVSVVGATLSVTPTVTISEINATGATVWTTSATLGAKQWWTTPHDLVVTTPTLNHTFAAGSTILVLADITVGASDLVTIWYNATWVPSHVVIQSDDFAQVQSLAFQDANGVARQNFDPLAANKAITVVANVTDPLGGYDVAWVNLTLVRPGGGVVLNAVPMAKSAGTPISYVSTYEYAWNYSGQPVGRYNASVGVLDYSGLYYFRQFFATGPYLASLASFFYIGGLPVYVNVEAVDSKSAALSGATIDLVSGGVAIDSATTTPAGLANFTMAKGQYTFRVVWEGVSVASQVYNASANVSAASPVVLSCQVYYPTFQAQDANGVALEDASLIFVMPNGNEVGPYKTDASGDVNLTQVPVGTYAILASWRGVPVYSGSASVSGNGVISFEAAVYELTVTVDGANGAPLTGAFVSVADATGLVFDAGYTNAAGSVILRLPAGNYTVEYRYITTVDGTSYDSGLRTTTVQLTSSKPLTVTLSDFPVPFTSTLAFLFAVVYAVTVAVLLAVLFLMWRRGKRGKEPAAKAEPAESEKKE